MKFKPVPSIKNPETEAYCSEMSKEYRAILKKHTVGSTEFIRARMMLSERIMEWARERNLVRWEQLAIGDRIRYLAENAA